MTTKKEWRWLGVIALSLALVVLAFVALRPHEPTYKGYTFTQWVRQYKVHSLYFSQDPNYPQGQEAVTALKAIGDEGVPIWLGWIKSLSTPTASRTVYRIRRIVRRVTPARFHSLTPLEAEGLITAYVDARGFTLVSAAPEVARLTDYKDPMVRIRAMQILMHIEPDQSKVRSVLSRKSKEDDDELVRLKADELLRTLPPTSPHLS